MKQKKLICLLLIYAIWLSSFASFASSQNQQQQNVNQAQLKGLQFHLREAAVQTEAQKIPHTSAVADLSEAEANAIFRRLPPIEAEKTEKFDFSLRPNSLPLPKTGDVVPIKFPADEQRSAPDIIEADSNVLEVVRFSPDGNVPLVSDLSVTFSQPMITVASRAKTSLAVPAKLSPNVEGKWRWLGTKTLIFDAEKRFPMATKFVATIPAGTKSATGGVLPKEVSWTFSTPAPKVESFVPNGETVRRDALLLASFNQEINAEAVLQKISATAINQKISLRMANPEEIAADEKIYTAVKQLQPNRWIVFRAVDLLPADSPILVNFQIGTPSAEGTLTTATLQGYLFKTFGNLKFAKSFCGYDENEKSCQSYEDLKIEFNNSLDVKSFDKSLVEIEPKIENAEISVNRNQIEISGCCKKTRTTYKVTVKENLKDEFGQTLGKSFSTNFKIGAVPAGLSQESRGEDFIILDPNGNRTFSVYSTNYSSLKIKLYAVQPEDYGKFYEFKQDEKPNLPNFGRLVFEKTIKIKSAPDEQTETRIDVKPALEKNFGHAVLIVEPPAATSENERIVNWLEATQIGVDGFADYEQLTVFASDLKNGKPLGSVNLKIANGTNGITDESGVANLQLPPKSENQIDWLIARKNSDSAILLAKNNYYDSDANWSRQTRTDSLRWFVFNDRNVYRPGETVSIKGYIRRIAGGKRADVGELSAAANDLNYVLKDSRGNEVLRGKANLNAFGAFDFQLKLPENLNLGYQRLEFAANGNLENKDFTHVFQVQEFRRPEFEVSAAAETAAPFYVGDSAITGVEAKYYSGGFLKNAETNWTLTAKPTNYTPPNRDDYTFGKFVPWWKNYYDGDYDERTSQQFKGVTDANGKHRLAVDFVSANPARPFTINAEARVQDVNRQTFAASVNLLVHPSELYVGIRTPKTFIGANEFFQVETITTDIDGVAVPDAPVFVIAELKDWRQIEGEWREVIIDTQTCEIKSGAGAGFCDFAAKQGGTFTIKASVLDRRERRNESEITVWVAGGNVEPSREVEQESAELVPDKKEYAGGETAEILVNAPFAPAEGVLTLRRNGIVKIERFAMDKSSIVLRVPIEEKYLPNIHVQVDLVGATKRILFDDERDAKLPKRPAFASGELNLEISTASRKLTVTAEPVSKTLEPGGSTTIDVAVKDNAGNAVANSEVAVVAVDESVLALTDYRISNPLDAFYLQLDAGATDYHSRENILLSIPDNIGIGVGYGSGNGSGSGASLPSLTNPSLSMRMETQGTIKRVVANINSPDQIKLRTNFNALAVFSPSVKTDANGKAIVNINLPDNLTRYRVTAIAVTDSKQFGITESAITAKQRLQVRPSAPRFMNFGDKIELPVVVQNQTDKEISVDVAIRATNAKLTNGNGKRVTIAANDRAEIRFPVAADKAGTAHFQIGATSGKLADAAEFEFPIYTPVTSEAFATYGTTDENGAIVQPISAPKDVYLQFGGLEITTSSTQLQELTDAFLYLQNYPFECSEQIASRILSVAALRDVLQAFDTKDLPSKTDIETKMKSDIERLQKLQHGDGGFSFWRSDDRSLPFVSAHAAHALARAAKKGYAVPKAASVNAANYLKNIEAKLPDSYSPEARRAISAYALYVRDLFGDKDAAKARKLLQDATLEKLSPESIGWILSVLANDKGSIAQVDAIKRHLLNRVTETAGAAHFVTNYTDGEYVLLSSERRADAVILEGLLKTESENSTEENAANPKSKIQNPKSDDLIPKIVRGLLANKTNGRWKNTQENVFVLLALDRYFQTYERVAPDFVAKIWLGQAFAGEQKFAGRSIDSNLINVPMQYLQQQNGASNLILDKQGSGRLYYRIGIKYAPVDLKLNAANYGFTIIREYEAIDDATDVKQNADGSWRIKSGARVRVKIQMVAPTRRYHVALVDNLPAGLEILNPELAASERLPDESMQQKLLAGERYSYYNSIWYDHQNLRDNRAEIFASLLPEGVWNYSYPARATTPGNFVVPPAKAEEMYAPETFGRSNADFVKVE